MAYRIPGFSFPLRAGADLTDGQHKFVELDVNGDVVVAAAGSIPVAVLQNDPDNGEEAALMENGITKMVAEEAITVGSDVMVGAAGGAAVATATNPIVGVALEGAGAAGSLFACLLQYRGVAS